MADMIAGHGGELALATLRAYGVTEMFTLSGGHVSRSTTPRTAPGSASTTSATKQSAVFAAKAVAKARRVALDQAHRSVGPAAGR